MKRPFLVAAMCGIALAGCGGTSPLQAGQLARQRHPPLRVGAGGAPSESLGRFAGYVWFGRVDSLEGSWRVPGVLPGSGRGQAGTWIGAQTPSWRDDAPFIQVGTNEGRFASTDGKHESNVYWAFWTDTRHHFVPITLFPVSAGDQIEAGLTLRSGHWSIAIRDLTSGSSAQFSTGEEAHNRFGMAEWEQEDVGTMRQAGPYPSLSPLTVRDVRVDGAPPDAGHVISQWMSSNLGPLAPSRLADDAFSLHPVSLAVTVRRYLSFAIPEDQAYRLFVWQMHYWTARTPPQVILSQQARFGAVLRATITAVSDVPWPPAAQPLIDRLATQTRALWALTTSGEAAYPAGVARWKRLFDQQLLVVASTARRARSLLGVPSGALG